MPGANESHAAGAAAGTKGPSNDEPTVLVRKLSSAEVPTFLERVLTQDGENRFVVVERLPRSGMTEDEASECVRDARMAADLEHPNVVRARTMTVRQDEISVASDYVAGERLSELWSPASGWGEPLSLEIALRILVDVSTGLGALHKLRSVDSQERVKFVHGEVTSENVLVGLDGVSMLLRASRVRRKNVLPKRGIGTLAPEVLSGGPADQRADVYSLGALLWQALSGRPLFSDDDVAAILASAERGSVPRAVVTNAASWAEPLADVAARALAPTPEKRFPTASSMITEVRKIAGPKMATEQDVARFVEAAAGEKIAARLADVQASAVIRKATSIPTPRSSPVPAPVIAEPRTEVSEPPKDATGVAPPNETGRSTPISPPTEAARPQAFPRLPEPKAPPPPSQKTKAARAQAFPQLPPEPKIAPPPEPRAEAARPQTSPEPPEAPTLVRAPVAPSAPSSPSPSAPAKPVSMPKKMTATREGAAAPKSRVVAKPKPAVSAPMPRTSLLAQSATRWAIGAYLAIALLTGWFILQAIRNRQDIVTPGAARADTSRALTSGEVTAEATNRAAGSTVASPAKVDAGRPTMPLATGRPAEPAASRKAAPPPKPQQK